MVARVFDLQPEASDESSECEAGSELRRLIRTRVEPSRTASSDQDFAAPRVGRVVSVDTRAVQVLFAGIERPIPARLACNATLEELELACVEQREVLLMFERADRDKPIITGLLSAAPRSAPVGGEDPRAAPPEGISLEADADGRRLSLSARDEIVFHCGKSSVTLTSSGRVILRGTYVETHASGTNRIKGGQVRIN